MRTNKRVLIVDDNPMNLGILEEMLADGYYLSFAQSGSEAIRLATRNPPAIILMDVMMPEMDGLEACRRIRQCAALHDVVIIMLSAKAMPSEREAGYNAGADDYITKPFDEVELVSILRHYTQRGRRTAQETPCDEEVQTELVRIV